ncbi:PAS domain S-box protein [Undibacterium sp. 14-3-2]|jgi:two-component system sensor histidine kinase VicK|uniref:ATP-binding protein n=1 Tax=Undibacterium sp. 14-3-2 TaxID=2800129 RepID=UPI0019052823|nr:ATP-binding protein [Undibacterium sp. 14-3-2]MBK1888657.1 PAS domain S-box protein [Undibacterium sp. 14-3-2]
MIQTGLHTSRIAKTFAISLVVAIVLAAGVFVWTLRLQEIHKWEKQTETFSVVLAENTSQQMDFAYTALGNIAERIQDRWSISAEYLSSKLGTYDFHQFLKEKVALFPAIEVISILDVNGNVISTSRNFPSPAYNLADRDYFQVQRDHPTQGIYLSNPVRSKTTGDWIFFLSHRLTGSDGEFIGVAIIGISPKFYTKFYEKLNVDGHVSISLLRDDFTYLARWPDTEAVMGTKHAAASIHHRSIDADDRKSLVITSDTSALEYGKPSITAIQYLEKYPLIVYFSVDENLYLSDWHAISLAVAIVTVAAIAAVIAAFRVLIQLFIQKESDMQVMTELKREADVINRNQTRLLQNLTEQQKALKESSDRLQAIFQNAADGIVMTDDTGIVEAINPAAVAIYGYSSEEVVGKANHLFSPDGKLDMLEIAINNDDFQQTRRLRIETERLRRDGSLFPAELSISEYSLAGKRKLITIVRDISERRKIDRMKNEFISTVSHELRTPLTAIRGALGLLVGGAAGSIPEKLQPLILMAHKNSESLTRLINDLLDIQKIEAGKMDFAFERLNLLSLLELAVQQNQSIAEGRGVRLEIDVDLPRIRPIEINVDQGRFQQVLANLISNACKYSPEGGVVRVIALVVSACSVRVLVTDQGGGVPENFRDRIFKKFSQADSSDTRAKGGTGLGLAISKVIIQQMHGEIGFYNLPPEQGGGAHFYIDLPIVAASQSLISNLSPVL